MWMILGAVARAQVAPECADLEMPDDYNEQVQADFLANYVALATTYSAVHGPIPHEPGHAGVGLDVGIIPPLGCEKRFVLNYTKTEDTNKSPIVPRPRIIVALPALGKVVPYIGGAYVPPVPLLGTVNVIASLEVGAGAPIGEHFQLGGRFHATTQKTVGDIAGAFDPEDPPVDDIFVASTMGLDVLAGWETEHITPFLAAGVTDVSTFFLIGDDGYVANNLHPYFGPTFSVGADGKLFEHLHIAGELYGAPGGYSMPDRQAENVTPASRYGNIVTGRFRFAWEF